MDKESLTLIINGFDKRKFEQAVTLVLQDILGISAENEDSLVVKKGKQKSVTISTFYHLTIDKRQWWIPHF